MTPYILHTIYLFFIYSINTSINMYNTYLPHIFNSFPFSSYITSITFAASFNPTFSPQCQVNENGLSTLNLKNSSSTLLYSNHLTVFPNAFLISTSLSILDKS